MNDLQDRYDMLSLADEIDCWLSIAHRDASAWVALGGLLSRLRAELRRLAENRG